MSVNYGELIPGVQNQIDRIRSAIADSYTAVSEKGGTLPSVETVDNLPAAIRSIEAGVNPTIIVTAEAGSTLTCGSQSYTLGASETTHTFVIPAFGTYIVTATKGSKTATKTVVVDVATEYTVPLAFEVPTGGVLLSASGVVGDGITAECTFSEGRWTVPGVKGEETALFDGVVFGENTTTITFESASSGVNASDVTVYIDGQSLGSKQWSTTARKTTYAIPADFLDGEPHTITITGGVLFFGVKTFTSAYFDV